jgi:hypothetical protein
MLVLALQFSRSHLTSGAGGDHENLWETLEDTASSTLGCEGTTPSKRKRRR